MTKKIEQNIKKFQLKNPEIKNNKIKIDKLKSGLYLLKIINDSGSLSKKVIVQ